MDLLHADIVVQAVDLFDVAREAVVVDVKLQPFGVLRGQQVDDPDRFRQEQRHRECGEGDQDPGEGTHGVEVGWD